MSAMGNRNGRGELEPVCLPAEAFAAALSNIDDLAEMKLALHCLAALQQKEGAYRYLREDELRHDKVLLDALGGRAALDDALRRAAENGILLVASVNLGDETRSLYTWNDADGRLWQRQVEAGNWKPASGQEIEALPPRTTLFQVYEDNIGVLTPMLAEAIEAAEREHPREWVEDAIRLAAERNARSWRYIAKVLESWQQEGRSREDDAGDALRQGWRSGKWADFIET